MSVTRCAGLENDWLSVAASISTQRHHGRDFWLTQVTGLLRAVSGDALKVGERKKKRSERKHEEIRLSLPPLDTTDFPKLEKNRSRIKNRGRGEKKGNEGEKENDERRRLPHSSAPVDTCGSFSINGPQE